MKKRNERRSRTALRRVNRRKIEGDQCSIASFDQDTELYVYMVFKNYERSSITIFFEEVGPLHVWLVFDT